MRQLDKSHPSCGNAVNVSRLTLFMEKINWTCFKSCPRFPTLCPLRDMGEYDMTVVVQIELVN